MLRTRVLTVALLLATCVSTAAVGTELADLGSMLQADDAAVRLDAVRRVALDYPDDGLRLLIEASADPDEHVRERAVQALGISGGAGVLPPLTAALADPADFVRWRSVQALDRLGARDVTDELAPLVDDPFWRVRVSTFELLGEIGGELLVGASGEADRSPEARKVRDLLISGLEDVDERCRLAAARALASLDDPAAYGPLVTLLQEGGSMFTRERAALGLGELGDTAAVRPLIDALEEPRNIRSRDGSGWVRWGVAVALEQLTGQDFRIDADKWRQWLAAQSQ